MVFSDSTSFRALLPKFENPYSKRTMKQNVDATNNANQKMERIRAIGLLLTADCVLGQWFLQRILPTCRPIAESTFLLAEITLNVIILPTPAKNRLKPSTVMNIHRQSFLATLMLCALALIFPAMNTTAAEAAVIGKLTFAPRCKVFVNGEEVASGTKLHEGDVIKTSPTCKAQIEFTDGESVAVNPGTQARVYKDGSTFVVAVAYGGVTPSSSGKVRVITFTEADAEVQGLPYLSAFGLANFPAGGGSSSGSGNIVSVVLPNGRTAYYDSLGRFIRFNN